MQSEIKIETGSEVSIDQLKVCYYKVISNVCRCGAGKRPGYPFCMTCSPKIPVELRNRLYIMVRRSFVVAYEEAETLIPQGPKKPRMPKKLSQTPTEQPRETVTAGGAPEPSEPRSTNL